MEHSSQGDSRKRHIGTAIEVAVIAGPMLIGWAAVMWTGTRMVINGATYLWGLL